MFALTGHQVTLPNDFQAGSSIRTRKHVKDKFTFPHFSPGKVMASIVTRRIGVGKHQRPGRRPRRGRRRCGGVPWTCFTDLTLMREGGPTRRRRSFEHDRRGIPPLLRAERAKAPRSIEKRRFRRGPSTIRSPEVDGTGLAVARGRGRHVGASPGTFASSHELLGFRGFALGAKGFLEP